MTWYDCARSLVVALERLAELVVSQRNATWAFAHGGVESGQRHYPPMVALHTGLLVACVVEVHLADRPFLPALGLDGARARRWPRTRCAGGASRRSATSGTPASSWCPGSPWCGAGRTAGCSHPNYVAVAVEGVALPLVHTAWVTALAFTVLNAVLLLGFRHPHRGTRAALGEPGAPA